MAKQQNIERSLNRREKVFIEAILQGKTQIEAMNIAKYCINSGYQAKSEYASKLMKKDKIRREIDRRTAEIEAKTDETITDRLQRFAELADIALKKGDLTNSLRAEENKSKIRGDYERDNQQQTNNLAAILINCK